MLRILHKAVYPYIRHNNSNQVTVGYIQMGKKIQSFLGDTTGFSYISDDLNADALVLSVVRVLIAIALI